ncbi:MAG: HU family DNA-binding protein [Desulfobacterales bacterium]|nr:HU family DNA-binding protein [Desulfobacterales bacterium]
MNKGDIVNAVAEIVATKKEAQAVVDCVFDSITAALKSKDSVQISSFGSFKVNKRDARKGRNPQTGAAIDIPARNVPKFTPGKALKDAVN